MGTASQPAKPAPFPTCLLHELVSSSDQLARVQGRIWSEGMQSFLPVSQRGTESPRQ